MARMLCLIRLRGSSLKQGCESKDRVFIYQLCLSFYIDPTRNAVREIDERVEGT